MQVGVWFRGVFCSAMRDVREGIKMVAKISLSQSHKSVRQEQDNLEINWRSKKMIPTEIHSVE